MTNKERIPKPKKIIDYNDRTISYDPEVEDIYYDGYNQAIDEYEKYHQQEMDRAFKTEVKLLNKIERLQSVLTGAVMSEEFLEKLSAIEHTRWSGWQEYLHTKCTRNQDGSLTIPAGYTENLERLIKTTYSSLTEKEKESDREEARKTIEVINKELLRRAKEE